MLARELLGAVSGQQHVFTFFENQPGKPDRIAYPFDGDDSSGLESGAVHEDRVELNFAVAIWVGSNARVEYGFIFEFDDRLLARVERGAAVPENTPSSIQSALETSLADLNEVQWNVPRAAVNHECDIFHRKSIAAPARG